MEKAGFEIHADIAALRKELNTGRADFKQFNADALKSATGVKKLEDAASSAGKKVGFLKTQFGQALVAMTGGFLGAGAITRTLSFFKSWGQAILGASSNMQELDSKARVVFGQTFPMVEERVKSIASEVGRSDSAILQYAADLGAVIDAAGLTTTATAAMSTEFAKLAVDLASFHNTSDVEAFNALRSAITGELEPLKRFGVVMTQANLQAYALDKGIKQKIETMSQAQLTALRYNYILARTTTAQGDAARTADSYANQARRLDGELTELNEQLGRSATPALASGLSVLNGVIQNVRLFVGALIEDIKTLFGLLQVNVGGSGIGGRIMSAVNGFVESAPVVGNVYKALKAGGGVVKNSIGNRLAERKAAEDSEAGPLGLPSLEEMMKQYAGKGKADGGAGAKKAADELAKAEKAVTDALTEQAKAALDNLKARREELMVRQKLGVLTREETNELDRINDRMEFSKEAIDDLVQKWEEQNDAIKKSQDKLEDYRKELKGLADDLAKSLKEIDDDVAKNRKEKIIELIKEQNEIRLKATGSEGLTGDMSRRLNEINGELSSATPEEMAAAEVEAGKAPVGALQQITNEGQEEKNRLIDEEKAKREVILGNIQKERDNLKTLSAEVQASHAEIVTALNNRLTQTSKTYALIEEATKNHVQAEIAQLAMLKAAYQDVGVSPSIGTIPSPSSSTSSVTNSTTVNNTVNQSNYGDAARAKSDAKSIRWELQKQP